MFALECFNKDKLESLKLQMEKDRLLFQNKSECGKDMFKTKTMCVKVIILLFILNPVILTSGIIKLRLKRTGQYFHRTIKACMWF